MAFGNKDEQAKKEAEAAAKQAEEQERKEAEKATAAAKEQERKEAAAKEQQKSAQPGDGRTDLQGAQRPEQKKGEEPRETEENLRLQAAQKADQNMQAAQAPKPKDSGKKDVLGNPIYVNAQGQQVDAQGKPLGGAMNPGTMTHERAAVAMVTSTLPGGVEPTDPRTGRQGPQLPPGAQPMLAVPVTPGQLGVGTTQPSTKQPAPGSMSESPDQVTGNEGNPARVPDVNPGGAVQDQDRQPHGGKHPAGHGA